MGVTLNDIDMELLGLFRLIGAEAEDIKFGKFEQIDCDNFLRYRVKVTWARELSWRPDRNSPGHLFYLAISSALTTRRPCTTPVELRGYYVEVLSAKRGRAGAFPHDDRDCYEASLLICRDESPSGPKKPLPNREPQWT